MKEEHIQDYQSQQIKNICIIFNNVLCDHFNKTHKDKKNNYKYHDENMDMFLYLYEPNLNLNISVTVNNCCCISSPPCDGQLENIQKKKEIKPFLVYVII